MLVPGSNLSKHMIEKKLLIGKFLTHADLAQNVPQIDIWAFFKVSVFPPGESTPGKDWFLSLSQRYMSISREIPSRKWR